MNGSHGENMGGRSVPTWAVDASGSAPRDDDLSGYTDGACDGAWMGQHMIAPGDEVPAGAATRPSTSPDSRCPGWMTSRRIGRTPHAAARAVDPKNDSGHVRVFAGFGESGPQQAG